MVFFLKKKENTIKKIFWVREEIWIDHAYRVRCVERSHRIDVEHVRMLSIAAGNVRDSIGRTDTRMNV